MVSAAPAVGDASALRLACHSAAVGSSPWAARLSPHDMQNR